MKGVKWLIFQKKILFICLSLPVLSAFLVFALFSSSVSAISITQATINQTFRIQWRGGYHNCDYVGGNGYDADCETWYRNQPVTNNPPSTLPVILVSRNNERARTDVYAVVSQFAPAGGQANKYYNKYRLGLTLRQNVPSGQRFTLNEDLGKYKVSIEGVTNTGVSVRSDTCGYEIAEDSSYISHICYIDLDNYNTLASATFVLGSHSATVTSDEIGYVTYDYVFQLTGNTNDIRLTDITSVVQSSDDPMLSGQQELVNQSRIINSNIVDFKNQNHEDLQAIKDAIENQSESEREQIQEASDDAEDEANDSGADSEAQGQTLVQIISGFISAISNPNGGSCIIDVDLSLYHGGTHNMVDLCHLDPPSGVTTVLSIILIVFVIRACVAVVQAMLALYREFQS